MPSIDKNCPSVHLTGTAVDLSICDNNGVLLDMGTGFDVFAGNTSTDYYEYCNRKLSDREIRIKNNRRLLYNIMTSVGFVNYSEEWWHFDFGNQFWAAVTGREPFYSVAEVW